MPTHPGEPARSAPPPPLPPAPGAAPALPRPRGWRRRLLGGARSVQDPGVFHHVSLVAFLAWVGLGADGLSSSAYGPEEAFKALGAHTYLAVGLALATAFTVFVISYGYSRIIEQFPFGGGGYVVATRLLGAGAGVVSGSALIVDYVLTITISVAAGADALFSLGPHLGAWKLPAVFAVIALLVLMNLRGVKESVTVLTPIFLAFLVGHAVLIAGAVLGRLSELPALAAEVRSGYAEGLGTLGGVGMLALFLRAYSLGGGTYTGIEAVSNGLAIMREPKVHTGKRTMLLMAVSLALTAAGITLAYLLLRVSPVEGKTMNAVLAERFAAGLPLHAGGGAVGHAFVLLILVSEALLLFVAAQAGFIDGPRVMANMASDSWLPHRFSQLSDRLVTQNGVLLMGGASLAALLYTRGDVGHLVVLYSINVFVTFSLSQAAMCRFWLRGRRRHADWKRHIAVHVVGLMLCLGILGVTVYEKFGQGGWVTLALTGLLVALCFLIRAHYRGVRRNLRRLDEILPALPREASGEARALEPLAPTAVLLVGEYAGLGVHQLLAVERLFPRHFRNYVFVSVGVVDSASFKDVEEVEEVRQRTQAALARYVALARRLGFAADARMGVGTETVAEAERLCREVARVYPRSVFFAGKLVFQREKWFQGLLHNETGYALQRRLQFAGLDAMVLPVRVLGTAA
ncbi:APC family permease [Aggregicoccus sp. 17bor-14]|uniref:APC family permease n=1 Tax=Myxococcaceae TaxID=31 RepID=UPI00129D1BD0|nr:MULTISPECIES: APC family permease [Myxococcaceae]MBF5045248.1 APC family permease [Simulacricoccus sp. 17bor-14]MRI90989.1 APC family permease [Aggregicoccus sp. 17bor-14]